MSLALGICGVTFFLLKVGGPYPDFSSSLATEAYVTSIFVIPALLLIFGVLLRLRLAALEKRDAQIAASNGNVQYES